MSEVTERRPEQARAEEEVEQSAPSEAEPLRPRGEGEEQRAPGEADPLLPGEVDTLLPGEADPLLPGEADTWLPGEEVEQQPAPGEVDTLLPGDVDTLLPEEGGADEPVRPGSAVEAVDSVEQARDYGAVLERAGKSRALGRYVVLDSLGQGGFGVVLRAYDRQLDRAVALKVLRGALDERHAQRLRREAQALAKLSHPNVVQVFEVGEIDGQTFVAMELVKGQTVRAWMNQTPRPGWWACVKLFVQLGAGLAAAHEQGLVHRDFKPGNAMIDGRGRGRVLDFGLARQAEDEGGDDPSATLQKVRRDALAAMPPSNRLTQTGAVLGTPAYMALEQMSGQPADARSDQFSFCVALYEALYGERPYEGEAVTELFMSMHNDMVRPAPRGSDVPVALRRVLLRGLEVEPDQRWPSMEALVEALWRVAAPRRRRGMMVGVGVGLVAVVGGLGAMWTMDRLERCTGAHKKLAGVWDEGRRQEVKAAILGTELSYAAGTWERVESQLDAYAEAWAAEHRDACEATRLRGEQNEEEMSLRMGCLHQRWQHLRATVGELGRADARVVKHASGAVASLPRLSRCRDLEVLRAEVPPPEDPAVAEQVAALDEVLVESNAKYEAGRYEEGLRLADDVVDKGLALGYEPLMARAWWRQGRLRTELGDYEGAVEVFEQAYGAAVAQSMKAEAADVSAQLMYVLSNSLARHEEARGWAKHAEPLSRVVGTDDVRAAYLHNLGTVAHAEGKYEDAQESYERALAILEKAWGPDHPKVATSLNGLGVIAHLQGRHEDAQEFYERTLVIWDEALGPNHPDVAAVLNNLGSVTSLLGKYEQSRELNERALAIWEKALGPDHPNVAISFTSLGAVAVFEGRYEDARVFHERALGILEKTLGPDHPNVSISLNNLGRVANLQGNYGQSRVLYERALAIRNEALGPDHPKVAASLHGLGTWAYSAGKYEQARALHEQALGIMDKALGSEHPKVAEQLDSLGKVACAQGKYEQARDFHERALAIRDEALGPDHPDVALSLDGLGKVACAQGQYEQARESYERARAIMDEALGPEHPKVAYPLTGLGEALLGLGQPSDALPLLERALAVRGPNDADLAETRFALARALWTTPVTQGRDRPRARTLAQQAHRAYADLGDAWETQRAEAEAWLAEHRVP